MDMTVSSFIKVEEENIKDIKLDDVGIKNSFTYNVYYGYLDIISSVIGLIIGLPFVLIFGVLIKIEDLGSVFYKQERLGKDGKWFNI